MKRILIVEDDTTFALMLKTWLGKRGFDVRTVSSVEGAKRALGEAAVDLVLTDMRLPDSDGIRLLEWMAASLPPTPAIVMTGYADIGNAVRSMKLGAKDYIAKPFNPDELLKKMEEALGGSEQSPLAAKSRTAAPDATPRGFIEGRSDASRKLYQYVDLVAPTNLSVLINGPSGTGKEHIARLIHERSPRREAAFVAIDCGSVPRELAASEFFGHVKGSFTGALADKTGAFAEANGGTLFLDEVGNLSLEIQMQLLRALQERRIRPVGGVRETAVDIRVIAATNEDLQAAMEKGAFRTDLYHRLCEFALQMPTLHEQREDVMLYADFFLDEANRELARSIVGFDAAAIALMTAYDWPGNLRQLKNTVLYATLLAQGDYITPQELPKELSAPSVAAPSAPASLRDPAGEQEQIRRALSAAAGNKSRAARLLGIDRKTLYNKLKLYGIE